MKYYDIDSFFSALETRNIEGVHKGIEKGYHARSSRGGGQTALMRAVELGFAGGIEVLLKTATKTDINAADSIGNTALIYAAQNGLKKLVQLLIEHGADVDHQNTNGQTALIRAIRFRRIQNIPPILAAGADINKNCQSHHSALNCAIQENLLDVMTDLIERGANVNTQTSEGMTQLMRSAVESSWPFVNKLLEAGANTTAIDNDGNDVLILCASGGNYDVLAHLLDHGLPFDRRNTAGQTAEDVAEDDACRAILCAAREKVVLQKATDGAEKTGKNRSKRTL